MPTATLTCPHCSSSLRTTKAFHVGSRFRCPACGAAFAVGSQDVAATRPRARPALRPPEEAAPRGPGGWLVLLGVVGLALLLLAGAGVALALHFLPKNDASPPVAAGPAKTPADDGGPSAPQVLPPGPRQNPDNKGPQKDHPKPPDLPPDLPQPASEPPPEPWLPPEQQENVNAAIDRGVAFLEKNQTPGGTWSLGDQAGLAALPGLTLLECGVPADDPHVQKAAQFVRGAAPNLNTPHTTYELALSILFLDRLGDPKDEALIRSMALRLLAGQQPSGGWTYTCPSLSEKEENSLFTALEATRPRTALELVTTQPGGQGPADLFVGRVANQPPAAPPGGNTIPLPSGPTEEQLKQAKQAYDSLSPNLKAMPALKPPVADDQMVRGDSTDNSNTQFATLGLWAAGRHGVPMERALALLAKRFQVSQAASGGWEYHYTYHPQAGEAPAMTAAGLLGLAVGHGVTADLKGADVEKAGEDAQVESGMKALGRYINGRPPGLYFLWSVERVGMLYGRRTIADKEWYPWGTDFLLKEQQPDGSWRSGGYFGATPITDTCFSLLFLKRANLAKDLSSKLEFLTQTKKP